MLWYSSRTRDPPAYPQSRTTTNFPYHTAKHNSPLDPIKYKQKNNLRTKPWQTLNFLTHCTLPFPPPLEINTNSAEPSPFPSPPTASPLPPYTPSKSTPSYPPMSVATWLSRLPQRPRRVDKERNPYCRRHTARRRTACCAWQLTGSWRV